MCLPANIDEIQELTAEQAQALLLREQGRPLSLSNLQVLSDGVSAILAQHDDDLFLNGLNDISPPIAEALAQHQGALRLDALQELRPEVARALGRHRGDLSLNGLRELSDDAALALAGYEGDATEWRAAQAAAEEEQNQLFNEIGESINIASWDPGGGTPDGSEGEVHAHLPYPYLRHLSLNHIRTLSLLAASQVTSCCDYLSLDGVEAVDGELAAELAGAPNLSLDGLRSLGPDVAANLAKVTGELSLRGLVSLDPDDVILFAEEKPAELDGWPADAVSFAHDFIEAWEYGDVLGEEQLSRAVKLGLNRALWCRIGRPRGLREWSRVSDDDEGSADQVTDRQSKS